MLQDNHISLHEENFINTQPISDTHIDKRIETLAQQELTAIFTSANAASIVAEKLTLQQPTWGVFCLAGATAKMVTACFPKTKIIAVANNSKALAQIIRLHHGSRQLVFFCGKRRLPVLANNLLQAGITLEEITVYETFLMSHKINELFDGIIFFSPSAVESYLKENRILSETKLFSLGPSTTSALKKHSSNIEQATFPNEASILDKILTFAHSK